MNSVVSVIWQFEWQFFFLEKDLEGEMKNLSQRVKSALIKHWLAYGYFLWSDIMINETML